MLEVVVLPCVPATASTCWPLQHALGQPLRPGGVRNAAVEHRLDHGAAAAQRIPDHHDVGAIIELLGAVALR